MQFLEGYFGVYFFLSQDFKRGGGFVVVVVLLVCEDLDGMFDKFIPRAHYFHSLGQDQSTVAQRAETTVAECSLSNLPMIV